MAQKQVIPTWKTFYTVNTGSHDHCVYVYNDRVSHDQFITMASVYKFSCCAITCINCYRVQNKEAIDAVIFEGCKFRGRQV